MKSKIQVYTRYTFTKNISSAIMVQHPTSPNYTKRPLSQSTPNLDHPSLSANPLVLGYHFRQFRLLLTSKHFAFNNTILICKLLVIPVWSYDVPNLAEFRTLNGIQIVQSKRLGQMEPKVPYTRCTLLGNFLVLSV